MATEKLLIDLWGVNMNEVDTSDCTDVEDILSAVITYLSEQPTVDAVEVVRCKDCRYCQRDSNGMWCFNDYEHNLQPDDYCSYGERRTDNA